MLIRSIDDIAHIVNGRTYHWFNDEFSTPEVLQQLLMLTGAAKVVITTFSISESGVRMLVNLREANLLESLICVFDHTVRKNKLSMLLFANEQSDFILLSHIHAKVITITNDDWHIVVTCTMNFNDVERYEAGVICCDPMIALEYSTKLHEIIHEAIPYEPE